MLDDDPRRIRPFGPRAESCDEGADEGAASESPELAHALRLAQRLGEMPVPLAEIEAARERVRVRVFAAIATQYDTLRASAHAAERDAELRAPGTARTEAVSARAHGGVRIYPRHVGASMARQRKPRRALYVATAALALGLTGLLAASQAAGTSLPGSPLYGLKRGEEGIALSTAWSDARRGEVLSEIAQQRLAEARAEAAAGNAVEVHALTAELDTTMRTLIGLAARMDAQHEDSGTVAAALSRTLADERAALIAALRQGQTVLVQSLSSAAQDQQQAISAANLSLPSTQPGAVPAASPVFTSSPTPTPAVSPTPTPNSPPTGTSEPGQSGNPGSSTGSGTRPIRGMPGNNGQSGNRGGGPSGLPAGGSSGASVLPPPPAALGPLAGRHVE